MINGGLVSRAKVIEKWTNVNDLNGVILRRAWFLDSMVDWLISFCFSLRQDSSFINSVFGCFGVFNNDKAYDVHFHSIILFIFLFLLVNIIYLVSCTKIWIKVNEFL